MIILNVLLFLHCIQLKYIWKLFSFFFSIILILNFLFYYSNNTFQLNSSIPDISIVTSAE